MSRQMIMGNQAIALGALKAGVKLAAGYPGTPSSEIIEFIAKYKDRTGTYVEWSVNEKAAAEVAAGASYAGSRTLVTMKQVGLNVASDPVMCLSYVGVKGGMVIVSADDPGPISSQTEQDTRVFASYSKLPCFDPSTPYEAFEMIQDAFELSEKYHTPVLLRPTTRVDHAYESMEFPSLEKNSLNSEFEKDTNRWVIFPKSSYLNHKRIFDRNEHILPAEFSESKWNFIEGNGKASTGIAAGGISWCYVKEAVSILKARYPESEELKNISFLKIGTPYPFPEKLAEKFLTENKRIVVFEELDPVIENALIHICGKKGIKSDICGKADGTVPEAGELSVETAVSVLEKVLFNSEKKEESGAESVPELPVRPPVLCAGCPHRGSFYAVKQAMKGKKTAYCGDIGCYTLGNARPLDMTDTCLCMGADITMAQGFYHNENDRRCFSFIGDSTFFASGITGVINGVYNQARQTVCVLDNSTTAMTGHQPHPGTGVTMMGKTVEKLSIKKILEAAGVNPVLEVDPFNQEQAVAAVKQASEAEGVSAVIFKAPCIAVASKLGYKFKSPAEVQTEKCTGCQKCIRELGCPALSVSSTVLKNGRHGAEIDASICTGCGLCSGICPVKAIV